MEQKFNIELFLSALFGSNYNSTMPVYFFYTSGNEKYPKELLEEKQKILLKEQELNKLISLQKFEECVTLSQEIKRLKESFDVSLKTISSKKEERRKIQFDLDLSIKEERYEDAAKFRDELKKLYDENT